MEKHQARRVRISGRVQGVSYRFWTRMEAQRLGLTGWVRNEADGSVTALIAGPETAINAMIDLFWQGPRGASVTSVAVNDADAGASPNDFRITA